MGLFSKCELFKENGNVRAILLIVIGLIASAAFFIPPEFCQTYQELCETWRLFIHFDKVFHFMFFTGLSFCLPFPKGILGKITVFTLILILGVGIEAIQYYIPHRGASTHDLLANILGIFFGLFLKMLNHKTVRGVQNESP